MTKCVFFVIASELCERGNLQRKFMDCHAVFVKTARNDEFIVELSVSEVSIKSKYGFFALNLRHILNSVDFSPFCKRLKMTKSLSY